MSDANERWADLLPRVLSAIVMAAVGLVAIWLGGLVFSVLVMALTGVMLWELDNMTVQDESEVPFGLQRNMLPIGLGVAGGVCVILAGLVSGLFTVWFVVLPGLMFFLMPRELPVATALWAVAVTAAGYGLITLRHDGGIAAILWVVLVVVASDIMGYFAGRILGGKKFWPAISPKKTWSGTYAGWAGAAVVGLLFWLNGHVGFFAVLLSPFVAFAGQMGDIAESWIKRRTGVKDSSDLIPGHGGFLDRFDAMTGAVVLLVILSLVFTLPVSVSAGG